MKIGEIEINFLGNSGFFIKNSKSIFIDPYQISFSKEKADLILITHGHSDHCSIADIERIAKDGTVIVLPPDCQSKITKLDRKIEMQVVEPGDELTLDDVKIQVVSAYNLNKPFHPKSEGWNGYVLKFGNTIIYHSGDTDLIPEMQKLTGYGKQGNEFVVLLPVGGNFTMNAEEASKAVSIIKPSLAIPMHYGSVAGSEKDADRFVELCSKLGFKAEKLPRI